MFEVNKRGNEKLEGRFWKKKMTWLMTCHSTWKLNDVAFNNTKMVCHIL